MDNEEKDNVERILIGRFTKVNDVSFNVSQNYIITTEDKLRLCLFDVKKKIEKGEAWIAPLGIFITIILSFLTTDFKDFVFRASTWKAIFIILSILAFLWLIWATYLHRKSETIDDIINNIKTPKL